MRLRVDGQECSIWYYNRLPMMCTHVLLFRPYISITYYPEGYLIVHKPCILFCKGVFHWKFLPAAGQKLWAPRKLCMYVCMYVCRMEPAFYISFCLLGQDGLRFRKSLQKKFFWRHDEFFGPVRQARFFSAQTKANYVLFFSTGINETVFWATG
jgi:hypothetical protein